MLLGESLAFLHAYSPLRLAQVCLIPDEHNDHVGVSALFDFEQPILYMREGVSARDVVDEKRPCGASVELRSDALELLLASSVIDLELHVSLLLIAGVSHLYHSRPKVHPDRQVVLSSESLVREL